MISDLRLRLPQYIVAWQPTMPKPHDFLRRVQVAWNPILAHNVVLYARSLGWEGLAERIQQHRDPLGVALWYRLYMRYLALLINTANLCTRSPGEYAVPKCSLVGQRYAMHFSDVYCLIPCSKDKPKFHALLASIHAEHPTGILRLGKTNRKGAERLGVECFVPEHWPTVPWYAEVDLDIDYPWFRMDPNGSYPIPPNAKLFTHPDTPVFFNGSQLPLLNPRFMCVQCGFEDPSFYAHGDIFDCPKCSKRYSLTDIRKA